MAAYVQVPRDLSRVKTKVLFNLTKRQLISIGIGTVLGLPVFFLLKGFTGNLSLSVLGMMFIMFPAFFIGFYEKDGQPAEKLIKQYVETAFIRPKVRIYRTSNYYALLMRQEEMEREVNCIVRKAEKRRQKKAGGKENR